MLCFTQCVDPVLCVFLSFLGAARRFGLLVVYVRVLAVKLRDRFKRLGFWVGAPGTKNLKFGVV